MAGKKNKKKPAAPPVIEQKEENKFSHQPFQVLAGLKDSLIRKEKQAAKTAEDTQKVLKPGDVATVKTKTAPPKPGQKAAPKPLEVPPQETEPADQTLFMQAVADVKPLADKKKRTPTPPPIDKWQVPEMPNEDLETLRSLSELVSGQGEFDLTMTDEYLEAQVKGLPPRLMEQLRLGRFPFQEYLDLHGMTVLQAEAAVTRFILDSIALGRSCVLLIHGRGLGSADGVPVLKRHLSDFLLRKTIKKYILAFTTARPVDGGLGASYVLLRR